MDRSKIVDVLRRLGFFHVEEVDRGSVSEFNVGHTQSVPFLALSRNKTTGDLSGAYAELVERIAIVLSRYSAENDEIIMLPPEKRQAWLAELACQAKLSTNELKAIVSKGKL